MIKEEKINGRSRWDVESDLRSIRDANKIRGDRKRFSAVKSLVKEEIGALSEFVSDKKMNFEAKK